LTYPTRSLAALHAKRAGYPAFECVSIATGDETLWMVEQREATATLDFAKLFSATVDWCAWIEIQKNQIPMLIATCFINEITEDVPKPLKVRPITPELWMPQKQRNAPVAIKETNTVVAMPVPLDQLVAQLFKK